MSNDQVAADTTALQNYIEQLKGIDESKRASEKQRILNETLKDSSQVAKDVAQNTNNPDDVMKVYSCVLLVTLDILYPARDVICKRYVRT